MPADEDHGGEEEDPDRPGRIAHALSLADFARQGGEFGNGSGFRKIGFPRVGEIGGGGEEESVALTDTEKARFTRCPQLPGSVQRHGDTFVFPHDLERGGFGTDIVGEGEGLAQLDIA